ncbi:MAG: DUF3515 family protein [Rhodoluna sp.]
MKFFRLLLLFVLLLLSGCSATVIMQPAEDANNPACAEVMVRLPNQTDNQNKRVTSSQSTAAWGEPVSVSLTCGLKPVEVSELACISAGGVDWLVDEKDQPIYRFISFGRTPATLVTVDSTKVSGASVLEDLGQAVQFTEKTKNCLG